MIHKLLSLSLFRSTAVYTIANIVNSSIPFLLIPILTRYLTKADYGIIAMFPVVTNLLTPLIGLNTHVAISIQYFHQDKIDLPKFVYNCFLILLGTSVVTCLFFFLFKNFISDMSHFPLQWIWLFPVFCFFQFISQVLLVLWINQAQPVKYGIFQVLQTVLNFVLSLVLVIEADFDWRGRIIGQATATILAGCVALYIIYKSKLIKPEPDIPYIKKAVRFGLPLVPTTLSVFVITMTDRIFITQMIGVSSTGEYALGYQIGMILGILSDSYNNAWGPWLLKSLKENKLAVKIKIVKYTYLYFLALIFAGLFISLSAPWFFDLFIGKEFRNATIYIIWIVMGFVFSGMYKTVSNYIYFIEKSQILMWITVIAAVLNIILNYVFIKVNGAVGAAQATTVVNFVFFLLTWLAAIKYFRMPWFSFFKVVK
ncbi:oligosaccharide flippase family protein [Rhodocytophaga rosea]|uniref:Oligosaccharide flippase family protein n=1 Tax=Rhodocytophaga rosea TaxID=2704465 RepID=A0A6C0GL76_9BACT|nr:oligosaccharide flippase family protein [Rhodocytophaga rosea]QHT68831.1 oligosaccharide flippase family protein [Rhodocytophaga rosea]